MEAEGDQAPLDVTKHPVKSKVNRGDAIDVIACLNRSAFTHGKCDITESNNILESNGSNPGASTKRIQSLSLS